MIERSVKVEMQLVYADCKCGGEFKATGEALMCNPPKFVHLCNKCGDHINSRDRYPVTRMVPIE